MTRKQMATLILPDHFFPFSYEKAFAKFYPKKIAVLEQILKNSFKVQDYVTLRGEKVGIVSTDCNTSICPKSK